LLSIALLFLSAFKYEFNPLLFKINIFTFE
jgi:hypothetical protein